MSVGGLEVEVEGGFPEFSEYCEQFRLNSHPQTKVPGIVELDCEYGHPPGPLFTPRVMHRIVTACTTVTETLLVDSVKVWFGVTNEFGGGRLILACGVS